jgi:hypothetical protein
MAHDGIDPVFEFEAPHFVDFTTLDEVDASQDNWFDTNILMQNFTFMFHSLKSPMTSHKKWKYSRGIKITTEFCKPGGIFEKQSYPRN